MKNKLKASVITALTILTLSTLAPITTFAATWNGVAGVSDAVVNSIGQYEAQAASYDNPIADLTWSITQNQNAIDTYTQYAEQAKNAKPGDAMYGQEAEWRQAVQNQIGPMNQRIAERAGLQNLKNQALANAANARAQADAEAAAILANQNKPTPVEPVNPTQPSEINTGGNNETVPSDSGSTTTSTSESQATEKPKETKPSESTESSTSESKPETKPSESKPETKPELPKSPEEAENIIIDNQDKIKEELSNFDHDKTITDLVKKNENGTYTVTEDAMKRAILDAINAERKKAGISPVQVSDGLVDYAVNKAEDHKNGYDHWDTAASKNAEKTFLDKYFNMDYVTNDLATFQSDFNSREVASQVDAVKLAEKLANGIVGDYNGFMSDGHAFDILDINAVLANIALTSKQVDYVDVWTGQTKQTTVWYLAYVYAAEIK